MGIRIRIDNLHKVYVKGPERLHVLKGIDLVVAAGDQVALTGVSGAGKSTLLHILGTLDHPSEGAVLFDDEPVFPRDDGALASLRNRRIGFVFQFHHLIEEFSAEENAAMPLIIRGVPRGAACERARAALARVGLDARRTHLPAELSGGEQQRVAIARALVGEPELLLMDEPSGNLDAATADDVHELIQGVARQTGATLIVVTHNAKLAQRLPLRYRIEDGRVAA